MTGPGRLTKSLGITGAFNGRIADERSGLWFTGRQKPAGFQVIRTPRIGFEYAGPIWSAKN
jgi:3-methyladenine DNA glycosylase Mpg